MRSQQRKSLGVGVRNFSLADCMHGFAGMDPGIFLIRLVTTTAVAEERAAVTKASDTPRGLPRKLW